jgi:hypothetical protein
VSAIPRQLLLAASAFLACDSRDEVPRPSPIAARPTSEVRVELADVLAPLSFVDHAGSQGIGMPSGCRMLLPTAQAPLPAGAVALLSEANSPELVVFIDAESGQSGIVPERGSGPPRPFPWRALAEPPPAARSTLGWLAALPGEPSGDLQTIVLWREHQEPSALAAGDRLEPKDLACFGDTCALLSTRVSKAAGPGASIFIGSPGESAATWRRVDIRPDGEGRLEPYALVDVSRSKPTVALASPERLEVWQVNPSGAERILRMTPEHDLLGVFLADVPVVITTDRPVERPCRRDGTGLVFVRSDGGSRGVEIPVAPERLLVRRLDEGLLAVWIAPMSCRLTHRSMVHALLLDATGLPLGSAMAVAEASDFALRTAGSEATIWLHRGSRLSRASATCRAKLPDSEGPAAAAPSGSSFKSPPE